MTTPTKKPRKVSMSRALSWCGVQQALGGLDGCPVGGWGETDQAMRRLREELPSRQDRDWTLGDLVASEMEEDSTGRWRWRRR
jgi:hypothetical protein